VNLRGADAAACGVTALVACSGDQKRWSDWFPMLSWGKEAPRAGTQNLDQGELDVDTLHLARSARHWRYRLIWHDPGGRLLIRRVALCVTDPEISDPRPEEPNRKAWGTRLDVPFLSQWHARTLPADRLCSPTAVAMVSRFLGVDADLETVAERAFDAASDLYGNWSFNVLAASLGGLSAYVDRGHRVRYLEDHLALGRPVIASIAFEANTLEHAPIPRSSGHLVVVCGFTASGDPVVRDPASREPGSWITYRRESFAKAWLNHGGTVYLLSREQA